MERPGKGTSADRFVSDYCVLDLETTGVFVSSAQIIEVSALKVRNNKVTEKFSTLVNPCCHIPEAATAVNHITDEMVKDAPDIETVLDELIPFLGNDVIVGYNNAGFDMNLIYDKLQSLKGETFGNDYLDILHAARRSLSGLDNYKLETISKYYGLNTEGEHRALKDCYLTKCCYERLYREFGEVALIRRSYSSGSSVKGQRFRVSAETKAIQDLQENLEDITSDGKITRGEFLFLKYWMEEHRDLQGNYPFDRVFDALDRVLADGIVTKEELEQLQELFSGYIDPVRSQSCRDIDCGFCGKHICVTGDFSYGSREQVFKLIEDIGAIVDKSVKKATQYVVVGAKGSDSWKTKNYGGKIQKAMELQAQGQDIKIIEEEIFIKSVTQ